MSISNKSVVGRRGGGKSPPSPKTWRAAAQGRFGHPRTRTMTMIVMLWKTLMSIDQNIDALRTRIPSNTIAAWMAAKMHHMVREIPSTFGAVKAVHTCGVNATGFMKTKAPTMVLKNLRSRKSWSIVFRMSTVVMRASF